MNISTVYVAVIAIRTEIFVEAVTSSFRKLVSLKDITASDKKR